MKTIFRLLCGLMAIALTTACSHEELLQTEPVQKPAEGKMVSVKAYTPANNPPRASPSMTRAQKA